MRLEVSVNFAPKSEEKQKQSPFVAIFSKPKRSIPQFVRLLSVLIEMKTKTKRFYLTILLFVVLLCDSCFIVKYCIFCALFHRHIRMKTKKIRKKGNFRLLCMGER